MSKISDEVFNELRTKIQTALKNPELMSLGEGMAMAMKQSMEELNIDIETLAMLVGVALKINHEMAGIVTKTPSDELAIERIKAAAMFGLHAPVIAMRISGDKLSELPPGLHQAMLDNIDSLPPEIREKVGAIIGAKPQDAAVH